MPTVVWVGVAGLQFGMNVFGAPLAESRFSLAVFGLK